MLWSYRYGLWTGAPSLHTHSLSSVTHWTQSLEWSSSDPFASCHFSLRNFRGLPAVNHFKSKFIQPGLPSNSTVTSIFLAPQHRPLSLFTRPRSAIELLFMLNAGWYSLCLDPSCFWLQLVCLRSAGLELSFLGPFWFHPRGSCSVPWQGGRAPFRYFMLAVPLLAPGSPLPPSEPSSTAWLRTQNTVKGTFLRFTSFHICVCGLACLHWLCA